MLAAFLTAIFFSLSVIMASRSVRIFGSTRANLGRLFFAVIALGVYAHTLGGGLGGAGRDWFLLSGVIGMGVGDIAQFAALPLLGSRLTVLMAQCLAAPIAMLAEWLWLDTALKPSQLAWSFVILGGVTIALLPSPANPTKVQIKPMGFILGFLAACGQGLGAVVSRKANALTTLAGQPIDGITAAYQRILGGFALTLLYFIVRELFAKKTAPEKTPAVPPAAARDYLWIPLNALCGAIIGVSCYQWALATTPSGIVLPIVATAPLVIVPMSYWFEGERPARRSLVGGAIAVAGVVALTLAR